MIKMRARCTWKRQDQSVAEVANETAKPKRSGLERLVVFGPTIPGNKSPERFGYRLNLSIDYYLKSC
jgi:hypothetical protein